MENKKVPLHQMEEYILLHNRVVVGLLALKGNIMSISEIEAKLPSSFKELLQAITKILKDNNIPVIEEESKVDRI